MTTPLHTMVKLTNRGDKMTLQQFVTLYETVTRGIDTAVKIDVDSLPSVVVSISTLIDLGFLQFDPDTETVTILSHWYESV